MADIGASGEMLELMNEMENLIRQNMLLMVKLHALSAMQSDTLASLESIRDRQLRVIDRVSIVRWAGSVGFADPA